MEGINEPDLISGHGLARTGVLWTQRGSVEPSDACRLTRSRKRGFGPTIPRLRLRVKQVSRVRRSSCECIAEQT